MCSLILCGVAALILCVCLLGMFFTYKLGKSISSAKCAVATASNDFLVGTKYAGTEWIGLSPAISEMDALNKNISATPNIIGDTFQNTDWIENDNKALLNELKGIYSSNKDRKLYNPTVLTSSKYDVNAIMIEKLGPMETSGTTTNALKQELDATVSASADGIAQIKAQANQLGQKTTDVTSAVTQGKELIESFSKSVEQFDGNLGDNMNLFDQVWNYVWYGIIGFFVT